MNKLFHVLWTFFTHLKYEIIYYILGARGVIEDLVYYKRNKCDPIQKSGEVAVVTGGARGLGAVMVEQLLRCDMHVIIGCRNVDAGKSVVEKVRESGIETGTATVFNVDMASLKSIKSFADNVMNETNKLNVLVNNAGIMFPPYSETEDGFESQWGVNYVGHFYLSHLLLNRLIATGNGSSSNTRIVNVTSCAHIAGHPFDFNNINMKNNYIPSAAYAQSKLAQLMFTKELDHQLNEKGVNVRSIAVHPGVVDTDIFNGTLLKILFPWAIKLFFKTPKQGAASILYAAISPKLDNMGGLYISNCHPSGISKVASDPLQQDKLFKHTLSCLNINRFGEL